MAFIGGGVKKKIFFKGPVLTRSGYGEQSRFALRALRSREDLFDIYIQPLQWGQTSWISEKDEERIWIDHTIEKTIAAAQQGVPFDASFQSTIPNEWERIAPVNIGYTAGMETTRVAHQWIQKGNEMDRIVVVSNHSKYTYENTSFTVTNQQTGQEQELRLNTPIDAVNYPVKDFGSPEELELELEYDYNFLVMAQMSPRKNVPNTVKWFIEEFHNDEVGLVLKINIAKNCLMDREQLYGQLRQFTAQYPDRKCKIYMLHGDMTDKEIHSLFEHPKISALTTLTHGEGFGLPIFEAAYTGLPVIAPGWSGQLDFLVNRNTNKDYFYNIDYDIQPVQEEVVWEGVIIKESMWAYPREQSAKQQMRKCYTDLIAGTETLAAENAKRLHKEFAEEIQNAKMVASVCEAIGINPDETLEEPILEFE